MTRTDSSETGPALERTGVAAEKSRWGLRSGVPGALKQEPSLAHSSAPHARNRPRGAPGWAARAVRTARSGRLTRRAREK